MYSGQQLWNSITQATVHAPSQPASSMYTEAVHVLCRTHRRLDAAAAACLVGPHLLKEASAVLAALEHNSGAKKKEMFVQTQVTNTHDERCGDPQHDHRPRCPTPSSTNNTGGVTAVLLADKPRLVCMCVRMCCMSCRQTHACARSIPAAAASGFEAAAPVGVKVLPQPVRWLAEGSAHVFEWHSLCLREEQVHKHLRMCRQKGRQR